MLLHFYTTCWIKPCFHDLNHWVYLSAGLPSRCPSCPSCPRLGSLRPFGSVHAAAEKIWHRRSVSGKLSLNLDVKSGWITGNHCCLWNLVNDLRVGGHFRRDSTAKKMWETCSVSWSNISSKQVWIVLMLINVDARVPSVLCSWLVQLALVCHRPWMDFWPSTGMSVRPSMWLMEKQELDDWLTLSEVNEKSSTYFKCVYMYYIYISSSKVWGAHLWLKIPILILNGSRSSNIMANIGQP